MSFKHVGYTPLLHVRPAEMEALEELPQYAKGTVLPYITLRRWSSSNQFANTISKVEACLHGHSAILDLTSEQLPSEQDWRQVHHKISALRNSRNGYENWVEFIAEHEYAIPSLQLGEPSEIPSQITALAKLGRGIVVRLPLESFAISSEISQLVANRAPNCLSYFILDLGQQNNGIDHLFENTLQSLIKIRNNLPQCFLSVAATTFPTSFVGIADQKIHEKEFFDALAEHFTEDRMIYSDWASTRASRQSGGSGAVPPRIDNSFAYRWEFFRVEDDTNDRQAAYKQAAVEAINSTNWVERDIWGTNQIRRLAEGSSDRIGSTKLATAIRINTHMFAQCEGFLSGGDSDDDVSWTD